MLREQQGFLNWLEDEGDVPYNLFVDNASTIKVSKEIIYSKRSKHFALRYLKVRDHSNHISFCPSKLNLSDPLTKALPRDSYLSMLRVGVDKPYQFDYCDDQYIKTYFFEA